MMEASGQTRVAHRPGALLFLFSTFEDRGKLKSVSLDPGQTVTALGDLTSD
jgi:hypothetical protein